MAIATLISIGSFDTLEQATRIAIKCEKKIKRKLKHDKYFWAKYASEIKISRVCEGCYVRSISGRPVELPSPYIPRIHITIDMPEDELFKRIDAELTRDLANISGYGFYLGSV